jgi:hypothetical protein
MAVTVVPCGDRHDGKITTVVQRYSDCPAGTLAFRIHPNTGNEHSGCYSPG